MPHSLGRDSTPRFVVSAVRAYAAQVCLLVSLMTGCVTLMAQDVSTPEPTVKEVLVLEEGDPVSDPDVLSLIETKVGQPRSSVDEARTRTHLDGLGRFENIVIASEPVAGGVRITYTLTPLRPIDRIEFRGELRLSQSVLRSTVRERLGSSMLASRIPAAEGLLRERYRENGFASPEISSELIPRTRPFRSTLVFTITAGPRLRVKDVMFAQSDPKELLVGLPNLRKGEFYDAARVRRTLDNYLDGMRRNGFYEARAEHYAEFLSDGVVLHVEVHRGPRVRLVFTGDQLTRSEQERLVPLRTEGTVNEDLLENATIDIEEYLRRRGYHDAKAPHTRVGDENELTITFDVKRGPRYVIADVAVKGRSAPNAPSDQDLRPPLALVRAGQPFIESVAEAVAGEIQRLYLNRGFVQVMVTGAYPATTPESANDPRRVHVNFTVVEGAEVKLRSVTFSGNTAVPTSDLLAAFTKNGVEIGKPLSAERLQAGLLAIDILYKDRGFDRMQRGQSTSAGIDDQRDLLIPIVEGMQVFVDRVIIEGNERTSREIIERELQLRPGQPLGATARLTSEARLRDLGLFRRVRIDERRHDEREDQRDVIVRVEEALRTTLGYGGGLEVSERLRPTGEGGAAEQRLDFVPRAFFEIGRRNMWGKNRSVNLFTRISGKSEDSEIVGQPGVFESSYGVNEYRFLGTFREPKVAGTQAEALFTAIAERAIRTSYGFITREVRAEVGGNVREHYNASVRFSVKKADLFDEKLTEDQKPLIDRLFPQVRLSKIAASLIRNTRFPNDLDPENGTYLSVDPEVAARLLGSEVGFVKTSMQFSWYRRLPIERRTIFAVRGVLGAAHGFERLAPVLEPDGSPSLNADGSPMLVPLQDLPASERFFAGGSTTHRGFSVDLLGIPCIPDPAPDHVGQCLNAATFTTTGFPTGGNGQVLINSEIRVGLFKAFTGVAFFDAGNVYKSASDISLADLRPAVGGGVHVRSPFGPVRFEVGFNLDRRVLVPANPDAGLAEIRERGYVFHLSLGPAF
jgi:outer membrane protein assembly complex protein YaeT